ncbi:hypothetical protein H114_32569 [Streptomyces gancidicus BKS 13-15]|uniref:Uncharacterized protein n=1 Tax=Streptomyces gancidicus BKS 13-15 TaxID=1284664 RepID=M3CS91_STREZ|nr:hypothetical protein [Streptomyces gancidicus]EMF20375.1 hypothetical protein H114_32569 [Streptomyces gancidicus BKS 13-15]
MTAAARRNKAARILRDRTRSNRAAARIARHGVGTLATHALATGLTIREARTVAQSLRRNVEKAGVTGIAGRSHAGRRMRDCTRYTPAEVARIAVIYKPRKPAYKAAAARLALAA